MSKKLPDGIVDIRGKSYQTVAYRVSAFRQAHPEHSLTTEVIVRDTECVVVCATIADPTGRVIANGHSEEYRKSSQINRTSALENAETSAIGRALAAFGLGGTEFASANEVQNAIHQQQAGDAREGQSQGGAVDPPAKSSRGSAHSALKGNLRELVHELNGCGDDAMLAALLSDKGTIETIAETRKHLPHLWDGIDWPERLERPETFVPLSELILNLQTKFAQAGDPLGGIDDEIIY